MEKLEIDEYEMMPAYALMEFSARSPQAVESAIQILRYNPHGPPVQAARFVGLAGGGSAAVDAICRFLGSDEHRLQFFEARGFGDTKLDSAQIRQILTSATGRVPYVSVADNDLRTPLTSLGDFVALNFSGCGDGVQHLANYVATSPTLRELHLSGCQLGDVGQWERAVGTNKNLKVLNLTMTSFGVGLERIIRAATSLEEINISNTGLSLAELRPVIDALTKHDNLLDVKMNGVLDTTPEFEETWKNLVTGVGQKGHLISISIVSPDDDPPPQTICGYLADLEELCAKHRQARRVLTGPPPGFPPLPPPRPLNDSAPQWWKDRDNQ